ncbi:MAG: hypothetical protein IPL77_10670 [Flavobacteriales bacterium]|nr:hypothetical protein [Flavobacteriales bacterium]
MHSCASPTPLAWTGRTRSALHRAAPHAREPVGAAQLLFFMWHLLESYGTDAEATYLIDHRGTLLRAVHQPGRLCMERDYRSPRRRYGGRTGGTMAMALSELT